MPTAFRTLMIPAVIGLPLACAPPTPRAGAPADDPPGRALRARSEVGGGNLEWAGPCVYAPDGKRVYAGTRDGAVYVIDPAAGKRVGSLTADPPDGTAARDASALAVSPDGRLVAASCPLRDRADPYSPKDFGWELRVWDVATGKVVGRARGTRWELKPLAFAPDGKRLAGTAWGYDKGVNGYLTQVFVWDTPALGQRHAMELQAGLGHGYRFNALALARHGGSNVLLAWSGTRLVRWDADTGKLTDDRQVPTWSYAAAFTPDGRSLVNTSYRRDANGLTVGADVHLIDVAAATVKAVAQAHAKEADRVFVSPDGRLAATSSTHGRDTVVFDAVTLARRATVAATGPAAYSPDGGTLVFAGTRYYDAATGRHRFTLGRHNVQVWGLAWSPDGRTIATSDNASLLWLGDPVGGKWTAHIPLGENTRTVRAVAYTPDGKTLAACEYDRVRLFDPADGRPKATLAGHTSGINAIAASADGKYLASASGTVRWVQDSPIQDPGEVIVWDLGTGKPVHTLKAHPRGTFAVAFSPDGKTLATGGGHPARELLGGPGDDDPTKGAVRLWDVATGKPTAAFPCDRNHHVGAVAFSPDGKTIAHTGIDGSVIRLLDLRAGRKRIDLRSKGGATQAVAFGKDGLLAAVGQAGGLNGSKGLVELWNPATGDLPASEVAHEQGINCLGWSPDGRTLATGGSDGAVWLWDVAPAGTK